MCVVEECILGYGSSIPWWGGAGGGRSNLYLLALLHHEVRTVVAVEVEAKELVQVLCERSARVWRVCACSTNGV